MFRRWLIRGSFIGLLLLFVAGWGVSTVRRVGCSYVHDRNEVACGVYPGEIHFAWSRGFAVPGGWDVWYHPQPFNVGVPDLWEHTSFTNDAFTRWSFGCMGFGYGHNTYKFPYYPRRENRDFGISFWFPIAVTAAGLVYAWRKTRPKLDPRTAFPVQIHGGGGA